MAGYHGPVSAERPKDDSTGHATQLLRNSAARTPSGSEELLRLLYDELHRIADRQMAGERDDHTLQPTALLNEAWMKLFEGEADSFEDRRHFLATAARAMRQILVDHARARGRDKRGGAWKRVQLPDEPAEAPTDEVDLIALDRALDDLRRLTPRHAQVVECRYFAELSVAETAAALDISERTVAREGRFAKAWLTNALEESAQADSEGDEAETSAD